MTFQWAEGCRIGDDLGFNVQGENCTKDEFDKYLEGFLYYCKTGKYESIVSEIDTHKDFLMDNYNFVFVTIKIKNDRDREFFSNNFDYKSE